jgi:hypothetical protein
MLMVVNMCGPGGSFVSIVGLNAPSLMTHIPPTHEVVAPHDIPHIPQLFGSVLVSVQPDAQQVWPGWQPGPPLHWAWHVLLTHASPAGHTLPQLPQFFGSLVVSTQPAGQQCRLPVQAGPPLQVAWHMLIEQLSPAGHALPQFPQFFGSLVVSAQPEGQHFSVPVQAGPPLHWAWQLLITQGSPAGQTLPQLPQFFGSLVVSVQPVVQQCSLPVQAGPPLQVAWHMLIEQLSPGGQSLLQPPQFFGSLVVSVQPEGQHVWVAVHAGPPLHCIVEVHWLFWHDSPAGHMWKQEPQLFGSLVVSTHWLPHAWSGGMQITVPQTSPPFGCGKQHAPIWQRLAPAGHALPQPPQFARSVVVSTQPPAQQDRPAGQPCVSQLPCWQTPRTQNDPAPHACPQVPQFDASELVSTSQPSKTWWSQSAKPVLHETISHALVTQPVVPFGTVGQTFPHMPQLFGSLAVFAHCDPLQQVWPAGHVPPPPQPPAHVPPEQTSPAEHAWPQPPQFFGSVAVSTSQPSLATWSQSANVAAQAPMAHADPVQTAVALAKGPQTMPQPPQSPGLVVVSTQSGEQHVRPFVQASPLPQKPTHWKLSHTSPLGHWSLLVHCTQVCVSVRQWGVFGVDAQSASVLQPIPGGPPPLPPGPPPP